MSKVQVAVRVRPMNAREMQLDPTCVVRMQDNQTRILGSDDLPTSQHVKGEKTFTFDHSFWSVNEADDHFADQETVYKHLGTGVLDNAMKGYNACIFAYGQTGSGKSYTMMGADSDRGIIPRLCQNLFQIIEESQGQHISFKVEVSYMEIYNEKVRDLLGDVGSQKTLRVREHKILGPYVEGLTKMAVRDLGTILQLMEEGNQSRTVASTNMNAVSSRSHAVFTIFLTQEQYDPLTKHKGQKTSRMSLVDLAGSERAGKTGASGARLREGSNINKSLTTLGLVISSLADAASHRRKTNFIPYRDSVLTWLLKDSLGGNSKTVMAATISPAIDNYEETMSTLRYADRAKRIVNHAVVNEDPSAKIIRQLKEEIERLKSQLGSAGTTMTDSELMSRLQENQTIMKEMELSWEEKLKMAEEKMRERQQAMEALGISVSTQGVAIDAAKYYLVNLNEDPSMTGMLVYHLEIPTTVVGSERDAEQHSIVFSGLGIRPRHAIISITESGEVLIESLNGAAVTVNGHDISASPEPTRLRHGARVLFGARHYFRVVAPHAPRDEAGAADWQTATAEMIAGEKSTVEMIKQAPENMRELILEKLRSCVDELRTANSISKDLRLPFMFESQVRLSEEALCDASVPIERASEVAVVMHHKEYSCKRVLQLETFRTRTLPSLEQHYERYLEGHAVTGVDSMLEENDMELIGVAHLFLAGVSHGMVGRARLPVVNKYGQRAGTLSVDVETFAKPPEEGGDHAERAGVDAVKPGDVLRVLLRPRTAEDIASGTSNLAADVAVRELTQDEEHAFPLLTSQQPRSMPGHTHEFNGSVAFAVTLSPPMLSRVSTHFIPIKIMGHTHVQSNVPVDDPSSPIKPTKRAVALKSTRLADHAALAHRWTYNIGYYNAWFEVLEIDDKGNFAPVHSTIPKDVGTGTLLRLRQGSARKIRITLKQQAGVRVPFLHIRSVHMGDFAVLGRQDTVPSSARTADLDALRQDYLAELNAHYDSDALQEQLRQSAQDHPDGKLDAKVSIQWQAFLKEKDALFAPEERSGLPGAGEMHLPRNRLGLEEQQLVAYVSHADDGAALAEELQHAMTLPVEDEEVDITAGRMVVVATWNAPSDLTALHAVTEDRHKVMARVRLVVDVEGSPNPLVLDKTLAFKVYNRKVSFKPSGWERLKEPGPRNAPQGCGLALQIVNGFPEFRDASAGGVDENASESLTQMQESCGNIVKMNRIQTNMAFQETTKAMKSKMRRRSMIGGASPRQTSNSSIDMNDLEKEVKQLQRLVNAAQAHDYEPVLLLLLVERLTNKQKILDRGVAGEWEVVDHTSPLVTSRSGRQKRHGSVRGAASSSQRSTPSHVHPSSPAAQERQSGLPSSPLSTSQPFDHDQNASPPPQPVSLSPAYDGQQERKRPEEQEEDGDKGQHVQEPAARSHRQSSPLAKETPTPTAAAFTSTNPSISSMATPSAPQTQPQPAATTAATTTTTEEVVSSSVGRAGTDESDAMTPASLREFQLSEFEVEEKAATQNAAAAAVNGTAEEKDQEEDGSVEDEDAAAAGKGKAQQRGAVGSQEQQLHESQVVTPFEATQISRDEGSGAKQEEEGVQVGEERDDDDEDEGDEEDDEEEGEEDDEEEGEEDDEEEGEEDDEEEGEEVEEEEVEKYEQREGSHQQPGDVEQVTQASPGRQHKPRKLPVAPGTPPTTRAIAGGEKEKAKQENEEHGAARAGTKAQTAHGHSATSKQGGDSTDAASSVRKPGKKPSSKASPKASSGPSSAATESRRSSGAHAVVTKTTRPKSGKGGKTGATRAAAGKKAPEEGTRSNASAVIATVTTTKKKRKKQASKWAGATAMPRVEFSVGDSVIVENAKVGPSRGVVRFMGMVEFGEGPWVGVELRSRPGKHDGSKQGVRYFTCPPGTGMFVRPDRVKKLDA